MNETKFDMNYFLETLMQRILYIAMNLPATYTTLLTVFVLWIFGITDQMIILYAALLVGVVLKLVFTLGSKHKQLKTEYVVIGIDIAAGLLVVLINTAVFEFIVLGLTILYLLYYSYIMTISYTRLGHNTEELLKDLRIRHNKKPQKTKKK